MKMRPQISRPCWVASRRHAEDMVAAGKVTVNGHVATVGKVMRGHR